MIMKNTDKEFKLNISPNILDMLGPSLYTNIYYVLAELIANAYDADAKNVYIISEKDSEIRVEDDGHGMSYNNGDIDKFLNIANTSRCSEEDSYSTCLRRRKMGRKGIGKLAALSISESVEVMTIVDDDKSGFIMTRKTSENNRLKAIEDDKISFKKIDKHGTAIVMKKPQYKLNKMLDAVKRNIIKIFPQVNDDFRIHIILKDNKITIDSFDKNIIKELCSIITLGKDFENLSQLVPIEFPEKHNELVECKDIFLEKLSMTNNNGEKKDYDLELKGWIGAYKTTRGRKKQISDFPDNFISLYANKKMGEFNILPIIGKNVLNEVYIVGELYIDLFELSELPDMALSNRQGYKTDDLRYRTVISYVRDKLLPEIIKKREQYVNLSKSDKKNKNLKKLKQREEELKKVIDTFKQKVSESASIEIKKRGTGQSTEQIKKIISECMNIHSLDLGIKSIIDTQKKKILISQTSSDKDFADIIYHMLLFNNIPKEEIIYTNCDDEEARIPEGISIYDYLRNFFVDSYSTEKICVIFVTSENTKKSWGAIAEIGASWITQINSKIFNIKPFFPPYPLDNRTQWQESAREIDPDTNTSIITMSKIDADIFCQKIEAICDNIGLSNSKKAREDNIEYLSHYVQIKPNR